MKNIKFLLVIATLILEMMSCSNKLKDTKEAAVNDKVQDTFFDATFGDSISDVINKFQINGFTIDQENSTEVMIRFSSAKSNKFAFGGLEWEMVDLNFTNGKFSGIDFYNAYHDKEDALKSYDFIKSTVEKKYNLSEIAPANEDSYKELFGNGKNGVYVDVLCDKYTSISNRILYGAHLYYGSDKVEGEEDNEL